jgi:hypothetical protein
MRVARSLDGMTDDQKAVFKKLVVTLAPLNWKKYNETQRASMVDKGKGTGEEMDWLLYREKKLLAVMKAWDAKDEKGNPIPVTQENVFKLHPLIAEMIINEYDRVTFLGEEERKNS